MWEYFLHRTSITSPCSLPLVSLFPLAPGFIEFDHAPDRLVHVWIFVTQQRGIANCIGLFAGLYELPESEVVAWGVPSVVESRMRSWINSYIGNQMKSQLRPGIISLFPLARGVLAHQTNSRPP